MSKYNTTWEVTENNQDKNNIKYLLLIVIIILISLTSLSGCMKQKKETREFYKEKLNKLIYEFHTGDENTDYQAIANQYNSLREEYKKNYSEPDEYFELRQKYVDLKRKFLEVSADVTYDKVSYYKDEGTYVLMLEDTNNGFNGCTFIFENGRICVMGTESITTYHSRPNMSWGSLKKNEVEVHYYGERDHVCWTYAVFTDRAIMISDSQDRNERGFYSQPSNYRNSSYYSAKAEGIGGVNECVRKLCGVTVRELTSPYYIESMHSME